MKDPFVFRDVATRRTVDYQGAICCGGDWVPIGKDFDSDVLVADAVKRSLKARGIDPDDALELSMLDDPGDVLVLDAVRRARQARPKGDGLLALSHIDEDDADVLIKDAERRARQAGRGDTLSLAMLTGDGNYDDDCLVADAIRRSLAARGEDPDTVEDNLTLSHGDDGEALVRDAIKRARAAQPFLDRTPATFASGLDGALLATA